MKFTTVILCLLFPLLIHKKTVAQVNQLPQLYSNAFGEKSKPAIIFLHGGPGYNSFSFEASTAENLAKEGYYVIVYDQRGCGRSAEQMGSEYTFKEAINDLNNIYNQYNISKATLIGHSWGGTLGIMFAGQHPEKVSSLVLTGSPVSYQQTFKAIIANCKRVYTEKNASEQLKYIAMLEEMDTTKLEYATYCFVHAMSSGQYQAKHPADNTKQLYQTMMTMPDAKYLSNMTQPPVAGFYQKENYTTLNLYDKVKALSVKMPVYGIYGKEDGLFDAVQLDAIKGTIGADKFIVVDNASHNLFIDQQELFIAKIKEYSRK